ncbi:hypothetical protein PF005_g654 [Phytophthora fragariae]|uniref:Uncharacterized protein n=2 Tax=Phytophthora TaxID=4783 RepID=A0A6A3TNP1_9STRA|nr:hypothetical protein PF003_g10385 [Phytophthora fragariae]KAE9032035.1 hypothetical protein PR001_g10796 [Phytophthora rubi]KAE8949575.1 hypothetical protein PF009_g903 [Phytophthora fragariae]KAE9010573.1 hypothetical protein PF011_g9770 [Phytophthora fragariae]KAE9139522.1 hypothetical protein PF010_g543 [Phytophthora fragariae]
MTETTESGVTAFAPRPAPTYRFVLTSQAEKVKILLENRKSKKQWSSGFLDEKEYVTTTNSIPNATLADYVKLFKDALEYLMDEPTKEDADDEEFQENSNSEKSNVSDGDSEQEATEELDPGKIRRNLTPLEGDALRLELTVKIRIFRSAWNAKYIFRLEPVSLDRIDILEAKLRDVQEELEETKKSLAEEKVKKVIHLSATSENVAKLKGTSLVWIAESDYFTLAKEESSICFLVAGWYIISLKVYLAPQTVGCSVELHQNDGRIASDTVPLCNKQASSASITYSGYFEMEDELSVITTGSPANVGGELAAVKIGD